MPQITEIPSSSRLLGNWLEVPASTLQSPTQQVVTDENYTPNSLHDCSESPLSEQLEPIAVVGMGCRLPGDVRSPSDFWDLMIDKRTGQQPKVPSSRFNIDAHFHPIAGNERPGSFPVLGGYFLNETLQEFDPSFFGITPIEAMWMDPQQRKLLEVTYEAFESAGATLQDVSGSQTAVFVASFTSDYQQMTFKEPCFRHSFAATGVDTGILSNRISHVFNLKGPSTYVNTACSSSLYALHNACNALRNRECVAAVVGGVNLIITVDQHMNTAKLGVLSPTSTCHTFDASADGYGRAEGVGAVYLKRLSDAINDGDPIRAVIRSSATNNNGKVLGVGITHPNRDGQVDVITHAYRRGGNLDPRLTGYFECHGTGTPVGDPLEVHAVSLAMNQRRAPGDEPLIIGAVKTSIGHSEAASGLSALIKAVLTVERGIIPPTRGIVTLNPAVKWNDWQVRPATEVSFFPAHLPVKRVSVNSFGYGGTNAHVIVEGADSLLATKQCYKLRSPSPVVDRSVSRLSGCDESRPFLLTFSAHEKAALRGNMIAHGAVAANYHLADLSYTLGNRRSAFPARSYLVASHLEGLNKLTPREVDTLPTAEHKKAAGLCFVFTGQGAQWPKMGAELMDYYPSFRNTIRTLDRVLSELADGQAPTWSLEQILLEPKNSSQVNAAEFAQPLTTAVQVALVQLLRSWGVTPWCVIGHSSGEIAAAYTAGHVSASEAIMLAYFRGQVVRDTNIDGAMLAVSLGSHDVESYLAKGKGKVVIACHNSPSGVTLSGDAASIEALQAEFNTANVFARVVKTDGRAYHSPHMAAATSRYEALVRRAKETAVFNDNPVVTSAVMVSSVTGCPVGQDVVIDASYFSTNLTKPVLFSQALQYLLTTPSLSHIDTLIEVGPHSALASPIRQIKAALMLPQLTYLPTLLRNENSATNLLNLAGELFIRHYSPLNMERVTSIEQIYGSDSVKAVGHKRGNLIVDLPPYQWGTKCYWAESRQSKEHRLARHPRHDLLGSLVPGCSMVEPTWRNVLRARDVPWLRDHCLGGEAVFPAAGYFSMAMEAIAQTFELEGDKGSVGEVEAFVLRDMAIHKALVTPDDDIGVEVLTSLRPATYHDVKASAGTGVVGRWFHFSISSISVSDGLSFQTTSSPRSAGGPIPPKYTPKTHVSGRIRLVIADNGTHADTSIGQHRAASHLAQLDATVPPLALSKPLTQRASGDEWYSALRRVGFNYGPTFNDMSDISFNGRDPVCTANTTIKATATARLSGPDMTSALLESRYFLHPACVDSALQLMIAAIYAGKSKSLAAGAIPIHVSEVRIWNRNRSRDRGEKTVDNGNEKPSGCSNGKITSWVNDRGARSVVCGNEMVDAEGRVLMRIEGMKCVLYEAAVPQGVHHPKNGPQGKRSLAYGRMVWGLDVDELLQRTRSSEDGETVVTLNGGVEWFVKLAAFKHPGMRVLDYSGGAFEDVLGKLDGVIFQSVKTDLESEHEGLRQYEDGSVDLIVADSEIFRRLGADVFVKILAEDGRLITPGAADTKSTVAPIASQFTIEAVLADQGETIGTIWSVSGAQQANRVQTVANIKTEIRLVYRGKAEAKLIPSVISEFSATSSGYDIIPTTLAAVLTAPIASLAHVIILDTSERPILFHPSKPEFRAIQKITTHAASLIWATAGGLLEAKIPAASLSSGLLRSVRSEQASLRAASLDFDLLSKFDCTTAQGELVLQQVAQIIVGKTVQQIENPSSMESEYAYDSERKCYISRLLPFDSVNETYRQDGKVGKNEDATKTVAQAWDMDMSENRVTARISGPAGEVTFERSLITRLEFDKRQVEVKVLYACPSRENLAGIIGGGHSQPTKFCHEIGGVVQAVGSGVTGLTIGDSVVGLSFDKFGTYQTVADGFLRKVSESKPATEDGKSRLARLVPLLLAYGAALHGLKGLADVQPGENVLVLSGTGHAGLAAINVANMLGAVPHVVVSTEEERLFMSSHYYLPADHIIHAADLSLSGLRRSPNVDVVFSAGVSPEELSREAWRLIAPCGRFINSGRSSHMQQNPLDTLSFQRGASYQSFDITDLCRVRPALVTGLLSELLELHDAGKLVGGVTSAVVTKSITDLGAVMAAAPTNDWTSPKTVISFEPHGLPASSCSSQLALGSINLTSSANPKPVAEFKPNATYLLIGCLGGLGRSLTSWMMERGARNFCFLSRSGADGAEAVQLVQNLLCSGVNVRIFRGNVGRLEDVERAVKEIPRDKPLRGVVQAAMVLKDGLFHSSTYEDWIASTEPKVHGTANLQAVLSTLPHALDFFLLTSSVSGILGTPGQANYAAGNAYLDAVARHRRGGGENACSVIVPMVLGVGVVAERDGLQETIKSRGLYGIDEEELLKALEIAVVEQQRDNGHTAEHAKQDRMDHLVFGLDPTLLAAAAWQDQIAEAQHDAFWMRDARFGMLVHHMRDSTSASENSRTGTVTNRSSVRSSITGAPTSRQAIKAAEESIKDKMSRMLLLDAGVFTEGGGGTIRSIASYGIDSMIGAELRNWLFREFELDIPFQQLLNPALTVGSLAERVCEACGVVNVVSEDSEAA